MEYRICQNFSSFQPFFVVSILYELFSSTNRIHSDNRLAKKVTIRSRYCIATHIKAFTLNMVHLGLDTFFVNYSCFSQHINSMHHAIFITMPMTLNCFCSILRKITFFLSAFNIYTWESYIHHILFPIWIYLIFPTLQMTESLQRLEYC